MSTTEHHHPVVAVRGKRKKRELRRLKRGRGRSFRQVSRLVNDVTERSGENVEVVPIVVVYRKGGSSVPEITDLTSGLFGGR